MPTDVGILAPIGETIDEVLDALLDGVRFKDLIINQSAASDARFYSLTIVRKRLSFNIPGTDIDFVFFPGPPGSGEADVPVTLEWRWGVRRYFRDFETALFSGSPRAYFDVLLSIANVTEAQLIDALVEALFGGADPYLEFVQDLKALVADVGAGVATIEDPEQEIADNAGAIGAALDTIIADLQDPAQLADPLFDRARRILDGLAAAADTLVIDLDVCRIAFEAAIRGLTDEGAMFERLRSVFSGWFGDFGWSDLEALLVPGFDLTITQMPVALEFPRKWLVPLNADGSEQLESAKSLLTFDVGSLRYSTRAGLTFDGQSNFTFDKSAIGRTGLTLEIETAKVDFSRTSNIAEADAAGYPPDFVGVFLEYIEIGLPKKWFEKYQDLNNPTTLGVVGRNLLIGTGGVTGEIGLEVLPAGTPTAIKNVPAAQDKMYFVLGKQPQGSAPRKGFKLGFESFDMKFRHNVIEQTRIKGSLVVPRLAPTAPDAAQAEIDIELRIDSDGDFKIAAHVPKGYELKAGNLFTFRADSLEVGKQDDKVYLSTSGELSFAGNPLLGSIITKPIALKKLKIHSDGSFELEGGTVPLPKSVSIKLGPAKIAITAIHFGSHEQEDAQGKLRHYRYWGFDGGVDINPGGIDARGDGIKYYYTVDGGQFHSFMTIDGIGIAMVIPGGASKEKAALLFDGYLKLKNPVYFGSIKFALPKAKIEGAAAMEYNTRRPAWIIDVSLELPKAIPLGNTSLGLYGFRGLFGFRYIAVKTVVKPPDFSMTLTDEDRWGDYYRADPKGVSVDRKKFMAPELTAGAKNPISIGVGVSLATLTDGGKAFTSQLFLLVSIPTMILLDGRADIMAEKRIGLLDPDPPFYAYIVISPQSIELGAGVDYLTPRDSGQLLAIHAAFEAAFFFEDHSAWFVHFGTKAKPMSARVLDMFDAYAYLMLSASGIEAGTGVHFHMHRKYGPVSASAHAYLDLWAYISFQGAQSGGGIAAGGMVDVSLFGIGFTISLATTLTVEAPKPYRIAGSAELCVSVRVLIKTFTECFTVKFEWMRDQSVDLTPVFALQGTVNGPPASAVHMLSGATYDVEFSTSPVKSRDCYIPLDAYVDVKFSKLLDPEPVGPLIGGYTSPPVGEAESVPPRFAEHIVEHRYALESAAIMIHADDGSWQPYHPYRVVAGDAFVPPADPLAPQSPPDLTQMPLGMWQKQDPGYGQIRFLALTPFSFVVPGADFRPEQSGVTPRNTYCVAHERTEKCLTWDAPWTYFPDQGYSRRDVLMRFEQGYAQVLPLSSPRLAPHSLGIVAGTQAIFRLPERVASCRIVLETGAPQVKIRFQRRKLPPGFVEPLPQAAVAWPIVEPEYEDVTIVTPSRAMLAGAPVTYFDPTAPIERIVIETPVPDYAAISAIEEQIDLLQEQWLAADARGRPAIEKQIAEARARLDREHARTCVLQKPEQSREVAALEVELAKTRAALEKARARHESVCTPPLPAPDRGAAVRDAVLDTLPPLPDGCVALVARLLRALFPPPPPPPPPPRECARLAREIAALEEQVRALEARLEEARRANKGGWPEGWQCATFVHELCWLSEANHAYNQSIPGIDAIEADFSTMRDAVERIVQPIWRPGHEYRIELAVSDTVTPPGGSGAKATRMLYVHFRTEAPIGHFTKFAAPEPAPEATMGVPAVDDGRAEVPECSLKFYIDMDRSFPDPGGRLLYAKPLYWADVELDLFFARPHAFHFFADWPDLGLGTRQYSMQIRVKDPAEARPTSGGVSIEPHQAAVGSPPTIGTQKWVEDRAPRRTEELTLASSFQHPLAGGGESSTACLAIGGGQIVPAARALHSALGDLEPDKLYTAVVLNRRLDTAPIAEAEVHRYPFRTSRHRDFASHIGSCMLADAEGNQRMAVFDILHDLADATLAAQAYAAARAVVARAATAFNAAYPDHFDLLIQGALKLMPQSPPDGIEFNFVTNSGIDPAETYGLWIRSDEPLNDPRIPDSERKAAIRLFVGETLPAGFEVLVAKDGCQAFVMAPAGASFPTADVAIEFDLLRWNPSTETYVPRPGGTVRTAWFARPVGGAP